MTGYVLTNLKVLVVEKQLFMRRLLGDVLLQMGVINVMKVSTIGEAIELSSKIEFDMVLLDWAPDMDAMEYLEVVRNSDSSRDPFVPVVVVTAYCEYMHVCEARDAGMTEYLTKPISATALYMRIKSIIERHRRFVKTQNFFGPDRRRRTDLPATGLPANEDRRKFTPHAVNA